MRAGEITRSTVIEPNDEEVSPETMIGGGPAGLIVTWLKRGSFSASLQEVSYSLLSGKKKPKYLIKQFLTCCRKMIEKHPSVNKQVSEKVVTTLDDCLDKYIIKEKLGTGDEWNCPKCKESVLATKKFDIWSLAGDSGPST